mmetsp:Transcript_51772/g.110754  ORF Transcript_51772/g.110754 Transcript_51772/m.110754 type:complete len:339 (+) Transcript_51772:637-1653(+)
MWMTLDLAIRPGNCPAPRLDHGLVRTGAPALVRRHCGRGVRRHNLARLSSRHRRLGGLHECLFQMPRARPGLGGHPARICPLAAAELEEVTEQEAHSLRDTSRSPLVDQGANLGEDRLQARTQGPIGAPVESGAGHGEERAEQFECIVWASRAPAEELLRACEQQLRGKHAAHEEPTHQLHIAQRPLLAPNASLLKSFNVTALLVSCFFLEETLEGALAVVEELAPEKIAAGSGIRRGRRRCSHGRRTDAWIRCQAHTEVHVHADELVLLGRLPKYLRDEDCNVLGSPHAASRNLLVENLEALHGQLVENRAHSTSHLGRCLSPIGDVLLEPLLLRCP